MTPEVLARHKRVGFGPNLKVAWDGNSLVIGFGLSAGQSLPSQAAALAPMAGTGTELANLGVSGQTTRQMNGLDGGSAADVDSAWNAYKSNVLVVWEGTNSIFNAGRTAAQAIQDLADYVSARRAARNWAKVMALTTLPRYLASSSTLNQTYNDACVAYNAGLMSNYRALGIDVVCDVRRVGSPYRYLPDWTLASFDSPSYPQRWQAGDGPNRIHPDATGVALLAQYVALDLRRL